MTTINKYIDKVLYINLEHRKDRKNNIEQLLNNYELCYDRIDAIYDKIGCVGCLLSHIKALYTAITSKCKNVLILEDDFTFKISKDEFNGCMEKLFTGGDDGGCIKFDVCCLVSLVFQKEPTQYDFLDRITEASNGAGYLVQGHYMYKLLETYRGAVTPLLNTGAHWLYVNDRVWNNLQREDMWVIFKKEIGFQLDGYSDISNCYKSHT